MTQKCESLKADVESISAEIERKRQYLTSFGPKLKELIDVSA